jgi:putative hemolysin
LKIPVFTQYNHSMKNQQPIKADSVISSPSTLGQINNLTCRLAESSDEVRKSQQMRYDVFFEELSATPSPASKLNRQDIDEYDRHCDHLLVMDDDLDESARSGKIVGSYRLLKQSKLSQTSEFYSQSEFDINTMIKRHPDKSFLEFGRSCVLHSYRNKRTIELLWQGSWAYVRRHQVDVMFGCASFEGTDIDKLAEPLSFLFHHKRAKGEWEVHAQREHSIDMNRIDIDALDNRSALRQLPPLVKGYLRLGAMIGGEAVIDHQFGCVDVLIILPVAQLNPRYVNYYGANAERYLPGK